MSNDAALSIAPYFEVADGKLEAFKALAKRFVETSLPEKGEGSLYYGWAFNGNVAYCRECYKDAQALLSHLSAVGHLLQEASTISTVSRVEVHGPAGELEKVKEALAGLNPQYFIFEFGFRA
eukprot:GGOE01056385.1.p2 GENE.GGOE01056385.1~~GGOE01056385.1.p2  ORF type:complete len:122 (-),score=25.93 GGOE01056385.1:13-378(-)